MLLQIPNLLTANQVSLARRILDSAPWTDGRVTAGHQSAQVKNNEQLPQDSPASEQLRAMVLEALGNNPLFISAALPARVFPPLFNRYAGGQSFGTHIDNAIRDGLRTDLSATLFFSHPDEYEGGELVVEDTYGVQTVKLPAGHLILYPASSLHHVRPVTKGARLASFFWVQSMIRDDAARTLLFDLDNAIQTLSPVHLTGIYHNLLRRWATP